MSRPGILLPTLIALCAVATALAQSPVATTDVGQPNVAWPTRPGDGRIFEDHVAVVEPEHCAPNANAYSTLLTYSAKRIEAWTPASMQPMWEKSIDCPFQPRNVLCTIDRLILATPFEIFAVDRRTGAVPWRLAIASDADDAEDLVDADRWVSYAASDHVIAAIDHRGRLCCIDAASGRRVWQKQLDPASVRLIGCDSRAVFVVRRQGATTLFDTFAISDDRPTTSTPIPGVYSAGPFVVTSFGLALCTDAGMAAFDSSAGSIRWNLPIEKPMVRRCFVGRNDAAYWLDEDGRLTALDLISGRPRWRLDVPMASGAEWLVLSADGRYVVAGKPGMIVNVDVSTGQLAWRHSGRAYPFAHPPIVAGDDLVVTYRTPAHPDESASAGPQHRYRVSRIAFETGMTMPASAFGDIVTEPISGFSGIATRHDAVILLDGQRLIGYVSTRYRK